MSPLLIQFPDAGSKITNFFVSYPGHERRFVFDKQNVTDFNSTGTAATDQFQSTLDGDPVVRTYRNFTVNAGHTVTTTKRCKGLYLNILGNCHISGILSMTARGANTPGKYILIEHGPQLIWFAPTADAFAARSIAHSTLIAAAGGKGGGGNAPGSAGIAGACGGGGAGASEYQISGFGAAGTSFSGGSGGGARMGRGTAYAGDAAPNGGAGGKGVALQGYTAGGGAGNPPGYGANTAAVFPAYNGPGQEGTGGLLILFVAGKLTFGTSGKIESHGMRGGFGYGSGGGSGGGAIHILYRDAIAEPAKITATGGLGGKHRSEQGWSGLPGKVGGNGTVNLVKI